ncbi:MAG: superoxide dismutase [Clostridiales bacterium]|nr:superoxide dismutase [Clostridiales bacterium]
MPFNTYPYELPPLPYALNALEPIIDEETMFYHFTRHFQNYCNTLNFLLEPYPTLQTLTLEEILSENFRLPPRDAQAILNNAGAVYNHYLYFNGLSPIGTGNHQPQGLLLDTINQTFGSFESFQRIFIQQGLSVFGSGWTMLGVNARDQLDIINLKDQYTSIQYMLRPLVIVDVWEHAYYLKHKNDRQSYLENIWSIINWPAIA